MRESIANSYVFSVVLIIISVCSALIIVSMNYSKVFKIKNRVIEIIEKYGKYNNNEVKDEIDAYLASAGYPAKPRNSFSCPVKDTSAGANQGFWGGGAHDPVIHYDNLLINTNQIRNVNQLGNYKYCIYEYKTAKGSYFQVSVYMDFDFPLIGDFIKLELPMYGDTKIIYDY